MGHCFGEFVQRNHEGECLREAESGQRHHPGLQPERLGLCPAESKEPLNVHL